jgi:hypothetical protein
MSKHVSRKQRWNQEDPRTYRSEWGKIIYDHDGWYSLLSYRTLVASAAAGGLPSWEAFRQRLGPFKRPRNAMVALEQEVTVLRNRHGKNVLFGDQLWAES